MSLRGAVNAHAIFTASESSVPAGQIIKSYCLGPVAVGRC